MYFLKVLFSGRFSWFYLFNSSYCRYMVYIYIYLFLRLLRSPGKSSLTSSLSIETKLLTFYAQTSGWQSTDPYNHPVFSRKPKYHPLLYWEFENPVFLGFLWANLIFLVYMALCVQWEAASSVLLNLLNLYSRNVWKPNFLLTPIILFVLMDV